MDGNIVKLLLPQVPSLVNTALWHGLGRTPTASKWDLRTTLTVQVLRSMMGDDRKPVPVGKVQATTTKELPVKGKMWVAAATMKAPHSDETDAERGLRSMVWAAIDALKPEDDGELVYTRPSLDDVQVEWTGFRPGAGKDEPLPELSEAEKFKRMMEEPTRTSDTTILYFHGGAYYLCDPATHRALCSRLAKESRGRVCNVRYRLAPQTAFPGQLLDALLVYLTLLYPPPGSMHAAVPAEHIVFGGDSAGGNLSFALLQLLLQFHRTSDHPTLRFHGKDVAVPLPAGVTSASPWLDICRSLPSITANAAFDYLPPPSDSLVFRFPPDDIWPAVPARGDLFCDLTLLDHPLASPLGAQQWAGAPPLWISTGQECLEDEGRSVAAEAAAQGVPVEFESYDGMPHVFCVLLPALPAADRHMRSWGDFCRRCVEDPKSVQGKGTFVHARTGKEDQLVVAEMKHVGTEEARQLMVDTKLRRMQVFERERSNMGPYGTKRGPERAAL